MLAFCCIYWVLQTSLLLLYTEKYLTPFNFRPIASVEGRKLQGTKITLYTVLNSKTVAANKFFYSI